MVVYKIFLKNFSGGKKEFSSPHRITITEEIRKEDSAWLFHGIFSMN